MPDDPSSIPGNHVVKGENQLPQVVLQLPHTHTHTQVCTHTTHKIKILKPFKRMERMNPLLSTLDRILLLALKVPTQSLPSTSAVTHSALRTLLS